MTNKELYEKAFNKWGNKQLVVAIEEMAELQKELTKALRGKPNRGNIAEEIADVEIMVEQVRQYFNLGLSVDVVKKHKLERLEERLKDEKQRKVFQ